MLPPHSAQPRQQNRFAYHFARSDNLRDLNIDGNLERLSRSIPFWPRGPAQGRFRLILYYTEHRADECVLVSARSEGELVSRSRHAERMQELPCLIIPRCKD